LEAESNGFVSMVMPIYIAAIAHTSFTFLAYVHCSANQEAAKSSLSSGALRGSRVLLVIRPSHRPSHPYPPLCGSHISASSPGAGIGFRKTLERKSIDAMLLLIDDNDAAARIRPG
jgi:hypothetical protein